jgi:hypothetical protein
VTSGGAITDRGGRVVGTDMSAYAYSQYLWPSFVSTALIAFLAWYGWRHRSIPAALPFTVACLFAVAWSIGSMLETAAVDPGTKVF